MTTNAFLRTAPPLTDADLTMLEQRVGKLHPSLRAHYAQHNGGVPERRFFEDDSSCEAGFDNFLSAVHRRSPREVLLEDYYQIFIESTQGSSEEYVPFARNGGDDLYVMKRDSGAIHFWAHDVPDAALRPVAASLAKMLERAETEDDFFG